MENIPPPNNNPNAPEEEPILDQAPTALVGFGPHWIGGQIPDNNNVWLEEDSKEEPKEKEENEAMVNDDEEDAEVINPYEEADPHNRPPPTFDKEIEFAPPVVQIADANDVPIPPVIQFGSNFHVGESSTSRDLLAGNSEEEPSIHTAPVPRDDPYVMVRDAAMYTRGDEDVDTDAPRDTQPSESHGSPRDSQIMPPKRRSQTNPQPTLTQEDVDQLVRDGIEAAIRNERERVRREATRAGGPAGGPAAAPMARDCSFASFIKCGPTQFHGTEGAVGLVRWFEKMENTYEISECVEGRKVKLATATLHGRALTWWNSQVATLGREVANGRPWAEVKQMTTDEFCQWTFTIRI
nr:putative zinc finger, CCHC-type, retrotransposon Gag domain protein [Tanacetum cinerariifolium]